MLGVDSNVVLRYLTRDDRAQFAVANSLFERADDRSLFLSLVVLVEVSWVLRRVFKLPALDVLQILDDLIDARQFLIEERPRVIQAIAMARATRADFADALIALGNEAHGCEHTVTFDVDALDLNQMIAVSEALT